MAIDLAFLGMAGGILLLTAWSLVGQLHRRRQFREELQRRTARIGVEGEPPAERREFWSARRSRQPRDLTAGEVAELALAVAARLRAGDPAGTAWEKAWPTERLGPFPGLDEPGAPRNLNEEAESKLQRSSEQLARDSMRSLRSACRFSHLVGAPLAGVLELIAESIAQAGQALAAQRQAFLGPRLSAQILALLPILLVVGSQILGFGSVVWLVSSPLGWGCLLLGSGFLGAGHVSTRALVRRAEREGAGQIGSTLVCDLACTGLSGGSSIPHLLTSLSEALQVPELDRIARELVLDTPWVQAWTPLPPETELLARGLRPAWEEGISPILLLTHLGSSRRRDMVARAQEAARRLEVQLVVPLGLLLLPAFIVLGIVPLVFTLLGQQGPL
ncbi:hypothetical protein VRY54_02345 [Actinomyces sp. F1_1611]